MFVRFDFRRVGVLAAGLAIAAAYWFDWSAVAVQPPAAPPGPAETPLAVRATGPGPIAAGATQVSPTELRGSRDLYAGYAARNPDRTVNVVVEIPAGTNAKWEVVPDGTMKWEVREGRARVVRFLPYPANYGMIIGTKIPKEDGGDGDALDIFMLGPALPRGTVVPVRVIGIMKYLDGGEQDDKILAVMDDTPLAGVRSIKQLDTEFPGASGVLRLWVDHYKAPGTMVFKGWDEADAASAFIDRWTVPAKK